MVKGMGARRGAAFIWYLGLEKWRPRRGSWWCPRFASRSTRKRGAASGGGNGVPVRFFFAHGGYTPFKEEGNGGAGAARHATERITGGRQRAGGV